MLLADWLLVSVDLFLAYKHPFYQGVTHRFWPQGRCWVTFRPFSWHYLTQHRSGEMLDSAKPVNPSSTDHSTRFVLGELRICKFYWRLVMVSAAVRIRTEEFYLAVVTIWA